MLSDETTEVDLVGPTLPVLKLLCDRAFHVRNGTLAILPKVLNAMLSACLKNIDDVRQVVILHVGSLQKLTVRHYFANSGADAELLQVSRRGTIYSPPCYFSLDFHKTSKLVNLSLSVLAMLLHRRLWEMTARFVLLYHLPLSRLQPLNRFLYRPPQRPYIVSLLSLLPALEAPASFSFALDNSFLALSNTSLALQNLTTASTIPN